jgi:excisionase family DNA binding protein
MAGEAKELLRPGDISAALGVTTGRVYQLIAEGVIPHVRVGNSIRIPRGVWEEWLAAQNRQAQGSAAR